MEDVTPGLTLPKLCALLHDDTATQRYLRRTHRSNAPLRRRLANATPNHRNKRNELLVLQVATSYFATLHAWRRYGTPNSPRPHEYTRAGVTGGAVSGARAASGCRVVAAMKPKLIVPPKPSSLFSHSFASSPLLLLERFNPYSFLFKPFSSFFEPFFSRFNTWVPVYDLAPLGGSQPNTFYARVSWQVYNDDSDVYFLASAILDILRNQ